MTRIAYIFSDLPHEMNCSKWNCLWPAEAVNKTEGNSAITMHVNQFTENSPETQKTLLECDLIVIERNYFDMTLPVMMQYKALGRSILCVYDDAYDIMHPKNVAYPFWKHGEITIPDENGKPKRIYKFPKPIDQFCFGLGIAKGIQVPSRYLAKDWSKYNKTYYVPNYIRAEKYENVSALYPHKDSTIIGWGGSLSHWASFVDSGALKALKRVAHKYKNVKIMISGDKRIFDEIDLPANKKIFQPYVPEEQFLPLLKTFDIAIAPLSGSYDKRRSRIKTLEYCALQIPFVASDYPPYEDMREYGTYIQNGADNWEQALCDMVDNLEEKREFAKGKPFEWAMTQSYDLNIGKTLELYEQIINTPYIGYIPNEPDDDGII